MRVPFTVDPLTKEVYAPSSVSLRLKDEIERKIRAEHYTTFVSAVETLVTICVQAIAKNFERNPLYTELLQSDKDYLVEILSTDLPLQLVITLIDVSIIIHTKPYALYIIASYHHYSFIYDILFPYTFSDIHTQILNLIKPSP